MLIKKIKLKDIKPYWRNPRNNSKTVEKVKESISKYDYNVPIVLDKNNIIITGHTRYKALCELGYKKIDCIISSMSPEKAKEYRIVDNKTNEYSFWDNEKLMAEIREFDNPEDMGIFFNEEEMSNLLDIGDIDIKNSDEVRDEIENDFDKRGNEFQDTYIEIECPSCGEKFTLSKQGILDTERKNKVFGEMYDKDKK